MNSKAKFPWLTRNVVGFSLASLMSDSNHEMVPLILPALVVQLVGSHAAPHYLGLISGFSTAAASISTLFTGWMSDRIKNRKSLILIGYGLTGTFVALLAFAQQWWQVFIISAVAWIGRGMVSAPRNAIIADSVDAPYYGHAFGFRQAFDTLGAILGPVIVYMLAGRPPQSLFLIAFIPGGLALLAVIIFIQEIPHRTIKTSQWAAFKEMPGSFYRFLSVLLVFGSGNFNRTLLLLYINQLIAPLYSTTSATRLITLLYIFRNIMQTFSSYFSGALSDSIGRKIPLSIFGFLCFGLMSLALIWPSTSIAYLVLIFFLSGISAGTYTSVEKSFAADILPTHQRGLGYGLVLTVTSVGDLIASLIVGYLWTSYSASVGFSYAAFMSVLAALLLSLLRLRPRYNRNNAKEDHKENSSHSTIFTFTSTSRKKNR